MTGDRCMHAGEKRRRGGKLRSTNDRGSEQGSLLPDDEAICWKRWRKRQDAKTPRRQDRYMSCRIRLAAGNVTICHKCHVQTPKRVSKNSDVCVDTSCQSSRTQPFDPSALSPNIILPRVNGRSDLTSDSDPPPHLRCSKTNVQRCTSYSQPRTSTRQARDRNTARRSLKRKLMHET